MTDQMDKDFNLASDMMNELLDDFENSEMQAGAAIGGALTALLFRLILSSEDQSTTIGMISSAMHHAAAAAASAEDEDEVRH